MSRRNKLIFGFATAIVLAGVLAFRIHLIWFSYFGGGKHYSDIVFDTLKTLEIWRVMSKTEKGVAAIYNDIASRYKLRYTISLDDLPNLDPVDRQMLNSNYFFVVPQTEDGHAGKKIQKVSWYNLGGTANIAFRFDEHGNPIDLIVNIL